MRLSDTLLGAGFALFAAWVWHLTNAFPAFPGQDYGPNLFPRILAAGIFACGALLVLRGLRARSRPVAVEAWVREPARVLSFLAIPGAALFYILAADALGLVPAAFAIVAALGMWFGARAVVALPVAAGVALLVHWFFGVLMRVPLPRGILDPFL